LYSTYCDIYITEFVFYSSLLHQCRGRDMVSLTTPVCDFGSSAIDFSLPGTDNKTWTLEDCRGPQGLLVMFICNHCPYVQAIRERLVRDTRELREYGIYSVAIMSNDTSTHKEDSFENMQVLARQYNFPFPYLLDESQAVAKAYGAVCTPDFFGYNKDLQLEYRGRLDASGKQTAAPGVRRELFEAMRQIAETGHGPAEQVASIGCSIKWREALA
jgi:peroxiredoxin